MIWLYCQHPTPDGLLNFSFAAVHWLDMLCFNPFSKFHVHIQCHCHFTMEYYIKQIYSAISCRSHSSTSQWDIPLGWHLYKGFPLATQFLIIKYVIRIQLSRTIVLNYFILCKYLTIMEEVSSVADETYLAVIQNDSEQNFKGFSGRNMVRSAAWLSLDKTWEWIQMHGTYTCNGQCLLTMWSTCVNKIIWQVINVTLQQIFLLHLHIKEADDCVLVNCSVNCIFTDKI